MELVRASGARVKAGCAQDAAVPGGAPATQAASDFSAYGDEGPEIEGRRMIEVQHLVPPLLR